MTGDRRPRVADFEAAGLYDPTAPDAAARLALLEYLAGIGATIDDFVLVAPEEVAVLGSFVGLFPDRTRIDIATLADRTGTTPEFLVRLWRACGFSDDDPVFGDAAEVFATVVAAVALFGEEPTLQFVRVLGAAAARVAEASISLFVVNAAPDAVARDDTLVELARINAEGVALVPALVSGFDLMLRHHMFAARRMDSAVVAPGADVQTRSIGFVDLVGSTALMGTLSPSELSVALNRFDAACSDVAAGHGGRLVKLIGDEAMFATTGPDVALQIALELIDEFADDDVLPPVRAALASGEVVSRDGDYSGPVVNRAARAVKLARPSSLLVDRDTRAGVDAAHYSSKSIGAFSFKGFAQRVPLYRVRRRTD